MLEIRKTAVSFDEGDLMELERIVTDADAKEALKFVKRSIYDRILHSQQGRLKSHLDTANPAEEFIQHNK
jgi:DNA replicative helicase MCM subunit Mcm2 (Cdc46/Mcm family)